MHIDFNEIMASNIVLLSKEDSKINSESELITIFEGIEVQVFEYDEGGNGQPDPLLAKGVAINYDLSEFPKWKDVKWCLLIDNNGIYHESEIKQFIK